jgi:hypothetical protein
LLASRAEARARQDPADRQPVKYDVRLSSKL